MENIDSIFNEVAARTLKKYREQKNMSLEDVVKHMKNPITRQSLFKYENGQARIKTEVFLDICSSLKIDPKRTFLDINEESMSIARKISEKNNEPVDIKLIGKNNSETIAKTFASQEMMDSYFANNSYVKFDNATPIELPKRIVKIPVLGTIKAGVPINAQQDILEYVDIPEEWTRGGKEFYGLKISGDSMEPKYNEKDIVIFEHTSDFSIANNKDCAVMVNGDDATFKNVSISEVGITLIPGNLNNSDGYKPTFYSIEQIEKLPVKIIGIAREKRTRL